MNKDQVTSSDDATIGHYMHIDNGGLDISFKLIRRVHPNGEPSHCEMVISYSSYDSAHSTITFQAPSAIECLKFANLFEKASKLMEELSNARA